MEPGIYDISNAEYHASEGISRSAISEMQKSPLHYWEKYLMPDREKQDPTAAMILGSAVHTLVLEPHNFDQEFAIFIKSDEHPNTKIAREHKASFYESSRGKQIITKEDFEKAEKMANAALSHRKVAQILNKAHVEKSLYWVDSELGLLCKSRPDIWNKELNIVGDLKTTSDSTPASFHKAVKDGNYHIQAAMQVDAIRALTGKAPDDFIFIAIQNNAPYKPYIYRLEEEAIDLGRSEYKDALRVFKRCIEINHWSVDRETVLPLFFRNFQKESTFYKLIEVYQCQS